MVTSRESLMDVETPAAVLDLARLKANCARMLAHCDRLGTPLRPHLKTLKSRQAAALAIDPRHGGVAVSTLKEARYFAEGGIEDIQCAVCLPPTKLREAAEVLRITSKFSFFIDSLQMAQAVVEAQSSEPFRVWIEIDSGEHRTGLAPDAANLLVVAETLRSGGVRLEGVATHAGQSYGAKAPEDMAHIADVERMCVVMAAERLRAVGYVCPGVSAGSTPTVVHTRSTEGLTELRAGVYMAGDLFQAAVGSLALDDLAFSVLATVISHDRARNQIVIDAGGLALSKDRSTAGLPGSDAGYGLVADLKGRLSFGRLLVSDVHQEHGEIRGGDLPLPFKDLPLGARVRVFTNHVCMTAAMYDRYHVVAGDDIVEADWSRINGWA